MARLWLRSERAHLSSFTPTCVTNMQVRPAYVPRHSFTLWYYDAIEKAEALANAKVAPMGGTASTAAQASARNLIRDILAQVCSCVWCS